jgi:glycosyltransferase involved in cell wall biosynthesis
VLAVGFREDLDAVYAAADVVAVPSLHPDPLPSAAIEAAAAGRCVVAAAHGGAPEIVRDGVSGRLVPPRDPGALAAVLAELADDPDRRARLAAAAAAEVPRRFARERLLAAVHDLYDRLLLGR